MISIITATYNSQNEIEETYNSIKMQTYEDWEWLVTDDCSTDSTLDILYSLAAQDDRIKVYKNKINSGAAVSRNISLENSRGDYIAFIDSDDVWLEKKLEMQLCFMGDDIDFSFTAYDLIDAESKNLNMFIDVSHSGSFDYKDMLLKKATIGCSTVMLRRKAFIDISMPLLRTGQDYATWLKLLKTGVKAHLFNQVCSHYRILPNSISRNKFKKAKRQWQIYRDVERLNFIYSIYCFQSYARRAIFRR